MQTAAALSVVFFSAFLALWPVAFLVVAALHAIAKRWGRVGQLVLLVPVWSIAASIGLAQFPRLLSLVEPSAQSSASFGSIAAVIFALACAAIAWALLVRSLGERSSSGHSNAASV